MFQELVQVCSLSLVNSLLQAFVRTLPGQGPHGLLRLCYHCSDLQKVHEEAGFGADQSLLQILYNHQALIDTC